MFVALRFTSLARARRAIASLLVACALARGAAEHTPETHDYGEDDEADGDHEMMD